MLSMEHVIVRRLLRCSTRTLLQCLVLFRYTGVFEKFTGIGVFIPRSMSGDDSCFPHPTPSQVFLISAITFFFSWKRENSVRVTF